MMKGLRTFLYELKYAFLQMKRHIMLCFSAISAIGITLLLIGSILIIGLHVNYFSNDVQKDLSIHVILNEDIDDEKLFENLKYFLERIMPVCDKYNINMAIHPDDPAWSVFGLPRIIINKKNILRMMQMVDNPHNGVTFCSGSYGTNLENDLPDMIRSLKGRIHFAHVRNLKFNSPTDFEEAAHLSSDGTFDMYEIMRALYEIGFDGPIRPDHGRMIWGEVAMPGYGLYDRALGATYLNGLWEAIEKGAARYETK